MNKRWLWMIGAGLALLFAAGLMGFELKNPRISMAAWAQSNSVAPKFPKAGMDDKIRVAIVLTEGAQMIDFAGPGEVFQDVMLIPPGKTMKDMKDALRAVYREWIEESDSYDRRHDRRARLHLDNAPAPRIVVVGAQDGSPKLADWLRRMDKQSEVVMSVCTGALQLGEAGLLDGKRATTHHDAFENFQEATFLLGVTLVKGQRLCKATT